MNCNNGKVNILGPNIDLRFQLSDRIPVNDTSSFRTALTGNWEDSGLSSMFFSRNNIITLQTGIKQGVLARSNGRYNIDDQDTDQLRIIMRSIFLQNSRNLSNNVNEQLNTLNKLVLDYCVPQVYGEVQGYLKYKQDASTMHTPINHPAYISKNDKSLEFKRWF